MARDYSLRLRMSLEEKKVLDDAAKQERRTKSEIIRKALEQYLKAREGK